MRTLGKGEVPEFDNIPGAQIKEKVKVAHVMWIPFFPLGKMWMIENKGNMYGLSPEAERVLNTKLGKSSYPFYSFLGLIAIPVLLLFFAGSNYLSGMAREKSSKKRFEKELAMNMENVNNPKKSDIFFFKDSKYKKVGLKVNYSSADSVYFLAPIDNQNKKWDRKNWAAGYYASENPSKEIAIAKKDLKETFRKAHNENMYRKGITISDIPLTGKIVLEKVETPDATKSIPIISETEVNSVKAGFAHFMEHSSNLDSLVFLIDQASHDYYQDVLTKATKKDAELVPLVRQNKKTNNCLFELMLYTKYVYLKTDKDGVSPNKTLTKETAKDYLFFLKLLERGFLTISDDLKKNARITDVSIPEKGRAVVNIQANSNMLTQKQKVNFQIEMTKENNQWKLNLPSAYAYSENQIRATSLYNRGNANKKWREMVIENVSSVGDDVYVGNEWMY